MCMQEKWQESAVGAQRLYEIKDLRHWCQKNNKKSKTKIANILLFVLLSLVSIKFCFTKKWKEIAVELFVVAVVALSCKNMHFIFSHICMYVWMYSMGTALHLLICIYVRYIQVIHSSAPQLTLNILNQKLCISNFILLIHSLLGGLLPPQLLHTYICTYLYVCTIVASLW